MEKKRIHHLVKVQSRKLRYFTISKPFKTSYPAVITVVPVGVSVRHNYKYSQGSHVGGGGNVLHEISEVLHLGGGGGNLLHEISKVLHLESNLLFPGGGGVIYYTKYQKCFISSQTYYFWGGGG